MQSRKKIAELISLISMQKEKKISKLLTFGGVDLPIKAGTENTKSPSLFYW